MLHFTTTRTIPCPAPEVWAVLADYDRDPAWREGVETMAPSTRGPAVVGTTTDEVLRLGGRTFRNAGLVTAVTPGHRLEWRTTAGADAHGARSVVPVGPDRCEVTLELHVQPHGLERLLQPMLRRMLAKGLAGDLDRLAALVAEAAAVSPR